MAGLANTLAKLRLEDAETKPAVYLDVRGRGLAATPYFQNQNCIGKFRTTKDKNYTTADVEIPRVLPHSQRQSILGTYLGTAYEEAELIPDYKEYHELKQKYFLKWIIDNDYFRGVAQNKYKKPEFICFGGRITDSMMTPEITRFGDWEMYAAKAHDCIYLWDEKMSETQKSKESYYGVYFEHLLTQVAPKASSPNEFDKVYVINEVSFGSHQLLCLNEIDAVDEAGNWVEIKVYRKCSPKGMSAKYLKYWAQSIVPGVKTLILGTRGDSGTVSNVEKTTVDAVSQRSEWSANRCFEFQDRLLTWIKSHFKENNPKIVKKFSWTCGDGCVRSSDVPERIIPKHMFPEGYLEDKQFKELFH